MYQEIVSLSPTVTPLRRLTAGGTVLHIKDETAQFGGSFKFRGPSRFLSRAGSAVRRVVTASTGNHAIGTSIAARSRAITPEIFIPKATPAAKRSAIEAAGGVITEVDGAYEDALAAASAHAESTGATLLPSYDHGDIVAGNRSLYAEAREQAGHAFGHVFVPVGGGGCVSGAILEMAADSSRVHACEYAPVSRVAKIAIRRECDDIRSDCAAEPSMEGIAIRTLGRLNRRIISEAEDLRIHSVGRRDIVAACALLHRELGIRAELGACVGVAAALAQPAEGPTLCVVTGGNIDPALHSELVEAA